MAASARGLRRSTRADEVGSKPPLLLAFRSSTPFIAFTVCLAVFTDIFLYGLVVPVMPFALTERAGIAEEDIQSWNAILLGAYSLALFIGSPISGIYADRTQSRRFPLLLGLLALAGSTILLCVGKHIALLVVGRILQGLSAAIVWSVGLALLADTVGRNIGLYMGFVSIALSVGLLISPLVGGGVYGALGYYAVFYVAFGLIFLDIVLRFVLIEKKVARRWENESGGHGCDYNKGSVVLKPQNSPVDRQELEVSKVDEEKQADGIGKADGAHAEDLAAKPRSQQQQNPPDQPGGGTRAKHPHWKILKSRRMLAALFGCVVQAGLMFAFDTVVPVFVKDTFHWNSTAAGLIFFCIFIPGFVSPWIGKLADRYGAKWLALAGFAASLPCLVCLRFVSDNTTAHKVLLGALMAIMGLTLTLSNVPLMAEIFFAIEAKEAAHPGIWGEEGVYGIGYGLFTTSFALGGTIGSLAAGYLNAGPGWSTMTWCLALWCALGVVDVLLWVGGPLPKAGGAQGGKQQDAESGPAGGTSAG
jgi:MFS family permease